MRLHGHVAPRLLNTGFGRIYFFTDYTGNGMALTKPYVPKLRIGPDSRESLTMPGGAQAGQANKTATTDHNAGNPALINGKNMSYYTH
ncbi:MAG: hypothetical protein KYX62_01660 [Pseudomonadota bacterium]|nr:hypothetical protein [Pseudomonadota bacterium]